MMSKRKVVALARDLWSYKPAVGQGNKDMWNKMVHVVRLHIPERYLHEYNAWVDHGKDMSTENTSEPT